MSLDDNDAEVCAHNRSTDRLAYTLLFGVLAGVATVNAAIPVIAEAPHFFEFTSPIRAFLLRSVAGWCGGTVVLQITFLTTLIAGFEGKFLNRIFLSAGLGGWLGLIVIACERIWQGTSGLVNEWASLLPAAILAAAIPAWFARLFFGFRMKRNSSNQKRVPLSIAHLLGLMTLISVLITLARILYFDESGFAFIGADQLILTFVIFFLAGLGALCLMFGLRETARLWQWLVRALVFPVIIPWSIAVVATITFGMEDNFLSETWFFTLPAFSFLMQLVTIFCSLRMLGYEYSRL